MCESEYVAAAERSTLIIFAAPEFGFLMKVVSDQTAAM
jgi:hypothetical protein